MQLVGLGLIVFSCSRQSARVCVCEMIIHLLSRWRPVLLGSDSLHPDGGCQSDTAPPEVKQSSADLILPGGSQPRLLCAELLQPAVEMMIRWRASVVLLEKKKNRTVIMIHPSVCLLQQCSAVLKSDLLLHVVGRRVL